MIRVEATERLPGSRSIASRTGDPEMTIDKDFQRLVRARMDKTGESYTSARASLLAQSPPPLPTDYEALAGMSDDAVRNATGRTWPEWTAQLDAAKAAAMEHRDIAAYVQKHHEVNGWWAQSITVGYERLRGLRDVGQRRGGGYDVNKSKTVAAPVETLWAAFEEPEVRERWLPADITIRTATAPNCSIVMSMAPPVVRIFRPARSSMSLTAWLVEVNIW